MKRDDYPAQEPLSAFARGYDEQLWARAATLPLTEAAYGPDPYQRMSIAPARGGDRRPAPVLVFLHGGGWTSGYKEWNHFMAPGLTESGICFVSAGYRLAPGTLFEGQRADCIAALTWVWRNIASYGGDPSRIFIGGHSAGGHWAALLAVRNDWQVAAGVPADVIRGCLPVSGVYAFGEGSGLSMRPRFLGADDPAVDRAASPLHGLDGRLPSFFLSWGERDFPHLVTQAGTMSEALRARGATVRTRVIAGAGHLEAHLAAGEADWQAEAVSFIRA
jgi:acetyl esterase/lipase